MKVNEIKRSERPTVSINSDIVGLMVGLHKKYPNIEWSGYIYFTQEGSLEDPDNLKFHVKDFVVLNVDSAAYTEINGSNADQIINLHDRVPELMEGSVIQGILHTHHSMRTFFSGTDTNTLFEAVSVLKFPLFLSVITNNALEIVAKIAVLGQQESQILSYVVENNKYIIKPMTSKSEVVYTFDCDIKIENNPRYSTDIELTDKYYKEKLKTKVKVPSFDNSFNFNKIDYYNTSKSNKNRNLRPLSDYKVDDNQLHLFTEVDDTSNSTLVERVNEYIISCILTDFAGEEFHLHTLQSALEDCHHTWNQNMVEYSEELTACLPEIFESCFKNSDIISILSVTSLEKEFEKFIEENKILHKEDYLFITKSILLNTKNYINGFRKELIDELNTTNVERRI